MIRQHHLSRVFILHRRKLGLITLSPWFLLNAGLIPCGRQGKRKKTQANNYRVRKCWVINSDTIPSEKNSCLLRRCIEAQSHQTLHQTSASLLGCKGASTQNYADFESPLPTDNVTQRRGSCSGSSLLFVQGSLLELHTKKTPPQHLTEPLPFTRPTKMSPRKTSRTEPEHQTKP